MNCDDELRNKAARIERYLSTRYGAEVFLVGSLAMGINVPGERDFDFMMAGEADRLEQLRNELSRDLRESPENRDGVDYHVFQGEVLGEDIDVALVHAPKADRQKQCLDRVNRTLTADQKNAIVRDKLRIKSSWFFPERRYKRYKKRLDRRLGLPRYKRAGLSGQAADPGPAARG